MSIDKQLLPINEYTRPAILNDGVQGIVIHYTASPYATAQNIRNYFAGTCIDIGRYASAHYVADNHEKIQLIPDNEVAYHAHDGNDCFVNQLDPNANFTSLSVEMCVNGSYEIEQPTEENAIELVAHLCKEHGLTENDIFRHYDVTDKNCPAPYVSEYGGSDAKFEWFKEEVAKKLNSGDNVSETKHDILGIVEITVNTLTVHSQASFGSSTIDYVHDGERYKVYRKANGLYDIGASQWISAGEEYVNFTPLNQSYHTVVSGDTLSEIAVAYNTTVNAIQAANGLSGTTIYVGQTLVIPNGGSERQYYTVQSGDTAWDIAQSRNMTVDDLEKLNPNMNLDVIHPGDKIRVK